MKYNNDWVKQQKERKFIFFWGNDEKKPFSQWQPTPFEVVGQNFATAEHWMMVHKALAFGDRESADIILKNPNPDAAKRQGKLVKNYDDKIWASQRYQVVVAGSLHKFTSTPELTKALLDTGDAILVEASPYDKIWGIGMDVNHPDVEDPEKWQGDNLLGYALMEARDVIRSAEEKYGDLKERKLD